MKYKTFVIAIEDKELEKLTPDQKVLLAQKKLATKLNASILKVEPVKEVEDGK